MRPYDVASWSLPLHMGVESFEINSLVKGMDDKLKLLEEIPAVNEESFADAWGLVFPASNNESYKAAFYALQQGVDVQRITEDIFLNEVQIKKGDFLIANSKKLDDLWPLLSVNQGNDTGKENSYAPNRPC